MAFIIIDGEALNNVNIQSYGYNVLVEDGGEGREWYVFQNRELAGEAARDRWAEMAEDDPEEFTNMVGTEVLVKWALGQHAGPGYRMVKSLQEWLDLHLDCPEDEFGQYDNTECSGTISKDIMEEFGYHDKEVVFYRCN